jgi:hypothetical protein
VVTIRRKPELAFKAVGGITGEVTGEVQRLLAVANLQTANSKQKYRPPPGLYKNLYFKINTEATISYINAYRKMWDEEGGR